MGSNDIKLRALWLNQELKKGKKEALREVGGFGKAATAAFGAISAGILFHKFRQEFSETFGLLSDANKITKGLRQTMVNAGVDIANQWGRVEDRLDRIVMLNRQHSGEEVRRGLDVLIHQTKDYEKGLSELQTAIDLAALKKIPLAQASDKVARAILGETEALGDLFPEIRTMIANGEIVTRTQEGAAKAIEFLRQKVKDQSRTLQSDASVQAIGFKNAWEDVRKAQFSAAIDTDNLGDAMAGVAREVREGSGAVGAYFKWLNKVNPVTNLFNQYLEDTAKRHREITKALQDGEDARDKWQEFLRGDQFQFNVAQPPGMAKPLAGSIFDTDAPLGKPPPEKPPWQMSDSDYIDALNNQYRKRGPRNTDGPTEAINAYIEKVKEIPNHVAEANSMWLQQQAIIGSQLQGTLVSALHGAAEEGWSGFISVAKNKLQNELFNWIAGSLLQVLSGNTMGDTGLLGMLFNRGGGGNQMSSSRLSHGIGPTRSSMIQQQQWRAARG